MPDRRDSKRMDWIETTAAAVPVEFRVTTSGYCEVKIGRIVASLGAANFREAIDRAIEALNNPPGADTQWLTGK